MKKKTKIKESQSVPSKTMIAQLQIIGGGPDDVKKLSTYLKNFTDTNDIDIKFIVSNDKIELRSVDWLIAELTQLKDGEQK